MTAHAPGWPRSYVFNPGLGVHVLTDAGDVVVSHVGASEESDHLLPIETGELHAFHATFPSQVGEKALDRLGEIHAAVDRDDRKLGRLGNRGR